MGPGVNHGGVGGVPTGAPKGRARGPGLPTRAWTRGASRGQAPGPNLRARAQTHGATRVPSEARA
eukprot:14837184-Alexandrium_andersonii.AAC.1